MKLFHRIKSTIRSYLVITVLVLLSACVSTPNPAFGFWDLKMDTPVGQIEAVLALSSDLTGNISSSQFGETAILNPLVNGDQISFGLQVDAQGQTLALQFTGTVDGDSLSGTFASPFGPVAVTGVRQAN